MFRFLAAGRGGRPDAGQSTSPTRDRYAAPPPTIYAIGDVHGCLVQLKILEQAIVADASAFEGEKWIVMLGDYIDRGPDSAGVVDHLIKPLPDGLRRLCLAGNHEIAMLDFLKDPTRNAGWLEFGGAETLASYGIEENLLNGSRAARRWMRDSLDRHVPEDHRAFLCSLPVLIETPQHIFVHAGLRPAVALEDQDVSDLLWIRDDFTETYREFGKLVVHGHTPRPEPLVTASRIALDTGAYLTGRLAAVRLSSHLAPKIMVANSKVVAFQ